MIIDKLIQADKEKLAGAASGEVEIKRLSDMLGEPFVLKLKSLGTKKMRELARSATTAATYTAQRRDGAVEKHSEDTLDGYRLTLSSIVEACVEPDFRDKRLLAKYETQSPEDVVAEIFLPGEIELISGKIRSLMEQTAQPAIDDAIKN